MRHAPFCLLLAACAGAAPAVPRDSAPADTSPTDTADLVTIRDWIWEEDRQCWALRDTPRPAEHWTAWLEDGCDGMGEYANEAYADADADGNCTRWAGGLHGDCAVSDPWVQPCETSSVPGCCDHPKLQGYSCFPATYEP